MRQQWKNGDRVDMMKHARRKCGLYLLTDHAAQYEFADGRVMHAAAGDLLFLPSGARYVCNFTAPAGQTVRSVLLNFTLSTEDDKNVMFNGEPIKLGACTQEVRSLFFKAAQYYKCAAVAGLKATVYDVIERVFPVVPNDACGLGYIHSHYTENFTVETLAAHCGMSEATYRRQFKRLTGTSPVKYINRLKIDVACKMLRHDELPPREVCDFLNFYSLPYFYKVFKETLGCTPIQYKERGK